MPYIAKNREVLGALSATPLRLLGVAKTASIRSLLHEKLEELATAEEQELSDSQLSGTGSNVAWDTSQESPHHEANGLNEQIVDHEHSDSLDDMKRTYPDEVLEKSIVFSAEGDAGSGKSEAGNGESATDENSPPKVPRRDERSDEGVELRKASTSTQEKASSSKGKSKGKRRTTDSEEGESWAKVKFTVQDLEGHNDIICAVSCDGSRLLTGSRDTMVKYWDLDKGTELRSMGGHSGTITSVILLPADESSDLASCYDLPVSDRIGVTGSKDCYIKVWSLETGRAVHSVYTYNPVECLGYIPDRALIISGSDGGKVELWDIRTGSSVFSTIGHEDSVTCIHINNTEVYTASSDGIIKLWHLRDNSLHPTFVSENISSTSSSHLLARRHIRSLAVHGDIIYYGDDGLNVKALDWKKALVHKLKNHTGDFGSTDAMCSTQDLLVCAGYDLDNGCGYLNFWHLPEEVYLATLNDRDISRVVAIGQTQTKEGALRLITGGQELRVWDRIPRKRYSPQDAVPAEFNYSFSVKAQDSDLDSDTTDASDSERGGANQRRGRRWSEGSAGSAKQSWWSWCTLV
ncbi:pre-mRNA-splicing factor PRP46-like isoform X2 [Acanthaster planci]|uniref:Pre-mRNA-splicing factor PRP46-like isoform X2 n=1 Tax=Acanthaster planci TaxID=133434 RepID=A0A8B7ZEQ9_ACAPL|nr:pre-mRNA-splicing factor PRP46-like isoform X2 [Acanthaster planci]